MSKSMSDSSYELSTATILIVDDVVANLQLLSNALNQSEFEVRCLAKGQMALRVAKSILPDIILLDINMPDISGYEVCQQLKADLETKEIPIIFLSAADGVFDKVKAFEVGAIDYICKPFQLEEVIERVKLHVQLKQLKSSLQEQVKVRTIQLSQALEASEAASKAKSLFLANMSHELRTPLNAIIGYGEMLEEEIEECGNCQELLAPDLKKIQFAARHLLGIINNILDLSKIEAGKMEVQLEEIDLNSLMAEAIATVKPLIKQNKNNLKIRTPKQTLTLYTDGFKVKQILINLLNNANKFTDRGTITLTANYGFKDGEDWINFSISDTGIGIDDRQLELIFQAFSQADFSHTRKYGGTGLGLTIVKQLCRILGGDILVNSELGKGSIFTVELPVIVR
jgi:signal transduction histidine kinase